MALKKATDRTSDELLSEISSKLNVLIAVSLRQLLDEKDFKRKLKQVGELARQLSVAGLSAKDIADITGSPLASVRTLLTPSQRK